MLFATGTCSEVKEHLNKQFVEHVLFWPQNFHLSYHNYVNTEFSISLSCSKYPTSVMPNFKWVHKKFSKSLSIDS